MNKAKKWNHNELAYDLSLVRQTAYLDMPLGSVWEKRPQRADLLEMKPSYTQYCIRIYEIKVSRSDFQQDVKKGKWKGYLNHCHYFYFAAPKGLLKKEEIPAGCGFVERCEKTWQTRLEPERQNIQIPYTTMMALAFYNSKDQFHIRRMNAMQFYLYKYADYKQQKKRFGKEVADAIKNHGDIKRLEWSVERYGELIQRLNVLLNGSDCSAWKAEFELNQYLKEMEKADLVKEQYK